MSRRDEAVEAWAAAVDAAYNPDRYPIMAAMFRDYADAGLDAALAVLQPATDRVEYGRAFWTDNGERLFVDDELFETFEEAAELTSLRWSGHVYDIVVKRVVTDWVPCDERLGDR